MATIRGPARALCTIGSALLILTGCDKLTGDGTDWARAALERNEQLTIVAYDKSAKTFTVKMRDTGELRVVRADQIVGTIPETPEAKAREKSAATAAAPSKSEPNANAPNTSTDQPKAGEVERPTAEVEARYPTANASKTGAATGSSSGGTAVITDAATGNVLASNTPTEDAAKSEARSDKKLLASGPGYSIKAGEPAPPPPIRLASRSSDIPSPARGVALEHRYEPMICQGQRMIHIDGRNLEFEGDAISAEDGCEIHITNSHIIAHGVGVSARAANVHIKNSVVEGDSGSVSASGGAQVYTQSSTFKGLSRRLDSASFHDLGGTVWN